MLIIHKITFVCLFCAPLSSAHLINSHNTKLGLSPQSHIIKDFAYPDRLKALSLPSLYYRKARGDMIECFKYISGMYKVSTNFIPLDSNSSTRGHSKKLKKLSAQKSCRAEFFTRRITNAWNSLPEGVISAPTLNTFKNRLDVAGRTRTSEG